MTRESSSVGIEIFLVKRWKMKIPIAEPIGGYQCVWSNLSENPKCSHGPTLQFGRYIDGEHIEFYACSACRDRKLCAFYLEKNTKPSKQQKQTWELEAKRVLPRYDHQKMYIRFNEMLAESPLRRMYCHDCSRLSFITEKHKHKDHDINENLTDYQMSHPTEILKPLENPKKEAQYLFSEKSTKDIIDMLLMLKAESILCIGAPRIHEYITNNLQDKMSSLLLDIDGRFHNFFGPLSFCWYNFFNHHFFNDGSKNVFKDFLMQNGGRNIYVVCDPPFGGRVEPMSQTLKTITDLHKKWNNVTTESEGLKIMFIFPYFMEATLREKANPPNVAGGLKELKMSDYKVNYDNHPLFVKSVDRKVGSQVRIFTNVDLNLLKLPESEGYKYCKRCKKWVSEENKHCKKCKECTSKDGRRYRHCNICARCVKPTWKHCNKCERCTLAVHKCGNAPKITGRCYKCNEFGHIEKACPKGFENITESNFTTNDKSTKGKKRKLNKGDEVVEKKKTKIEKLNDIVTEKKKKSVTTAEIKHTDKLNAENEKVKSKKLGQSSLNRKIREPVEKAVIETFKKKKQKRLNGKDSNPTTGRIIRKIKKVVT
ncbi:rRNA N6-adenosine-methyltransferase ZCCHC4 [Athalia rosae]|uniref:rRNA N6-adenosine-methyltransferase ZCCHC4 n=1 Tax=Athalia rosae TaxID=37344 RepID=UPI0020332A2F|nr:rRNA N6-adenosine-methyltransferase ZCCHC4 [Athalia rosae]